MKLYPYGFAAVIETWASISPSIYVGENDVILARRVSKTTQIKVHDQLNHLDAWNQTIESKELTRPTSADFSTVPTVRYAYFFPHTKLFNETDSYFYKDTIYHDISFLTPQYHLASLLFFFFSVETHNHFQHHVSGVSCRVSHNAKQCWF